MACRSSTSALATAISALSTCSSTSSMWAWPWTGTGSRCAWPPWIWRAGSGSGTPGRPPGRRSTGKRPRRSPTWRRATRTSPSTATSPRWWRRTTLLEVGPLGHLVAFGFGLLLPFQPVVLEDGLVVGDVDRVGVVGQFSVRRELVESVEIGVQGYSTSSEGYVLVDGQTQGVVHVVVLDIVGLAGLGVLQGHDGAVVLSKLGPQVERRQELRLVGAELPVTADKRVFGHESRQGLALRQHYHILKCELPVLD